MLHPRVVILILAALLSINALMPIGYAFGLGNFLQPIVQLLVTPGRPVYQALGGTRAIENPEADELAGFTDDQLRRDYALARVENERLRQQNLRLTERLAEILPLRDLLAERGLDQLRQLSARVNPGGADGTLAVAAGTDDGVAPGQTVVYGVHVVGRVAEPLGSGSASVALITRIGDRLRVTISPPANAQTAGGVAASRVTPLDTRVRLDVELGAFITEEVPTTSNVNVGDVVRLADELSFAEAQGFQLGRVTVVEPLPSNPLTLQRIVVEPALELPRLSRVTVLMPPSASQAGGGAP
ncbi:MAG: rod shape-determining protein MreC [Planctomycetota bacterium]